MKNMTEAEREQKERDFWINSEHESPQADSIGNIINKMTECAVFLKILEKYNSYFEHDIKLLEVGGGQGWASCALKKLYPKLKITLTDISEHAIQSLYKWEHIFKVNIDKSYSCATYKTPEADDSVDIIFCYAAAHHFTYLNKTMKEFWRILKPNGNCFFFHEPTCIRFFYRFAYI